MKTEDIPTEPASEWMPEADLEVVAIVGKLAEECCELAGICTRIVIQGLHELEPRTGMPNIQALEQEIADVEAMIAHARQRLPVVQSLITDRANRKFNYKLPWFDFLKGKGRA